MRSLEAFLYAFGPPAVFAAAIFDGDVTLLVAGAVAHLGYFHLYAAILAGMLGNLAADMGWYWVGRGGVSRLTRLVESGPRRRHVMRRVHGLADRLGVAEIMACRFVYGTRIVSMIYWGTRKLPFGTFVAADLAGCLVLSTILGCAGFFASHAASVVLGEIGSVEKWLAGAVILAVALVVALRLVSRHRLR